MNYTHAQSDVFCQHGKASNKMDYLGATRIEGKPLVTTQPLLCNLPHLCGRLSSAVSTTVGLMLFNMKFPSVCIQPLGPPTTFLQNSQLWDPQATPCIFTLWHPNPPRSTTVSRFLASCTSAFDGSLTLWHTSGPDYASPTLLTAKPPTLRQHSQTSDIRHKRSESSTQVHKRFTVVFAPQRHHLRKSDDDRFWSSDGGMPWLAGSKFHELFRCERSMVLRNLRHSASKPSELTSPEWAPRLVPIRAFECVVDR